MEGEIQIRGGKYLFAGKDGSISPIQSFGMNYLPGDRGVLKGSFVSNISRESQYFLGVLTKHDRGKFLISFPTHPAISLDMVYMGPAAIGNRVLLHLPETGGTLPLQIYDSNPCEDANIIMDAYKYYTSAPSLPTPSYTTPKYTKSFADLSHLETFTIDPKDSKDFDDAISVDLSGGTVYVHIVDAARLFPVENDQQLLKFGESLYVGQEKTIHLLPEKQATDEFSLIVGKPRAVITTELHFTPEGKIAKYEIYPSQIVVKQRFTYEEVNDRVNEYPAFRYLYKLSEISEAKTLDIPSSEFSLDSAGNPIFMNLVNTNDAAHKLVAYAMILTNFAVSDLLTKAGVVLPNRFHMSPRFGKAEVVSGNRFVDSFVQVKKWARAGYSTSASGHFGLSLPTYVHFTSPMRRFADVLVHRILAGASYATDALEQVSEYLTKRHTYVRMLQDFYKKTKTARFIQRLVSFPPFYVTDVAAAGISWYSPELQINGFQHVSTLGKGEYLKLEGGRLVGSKSTFSIGKKFFPKFISVNQATCQYTLHL